MRFIFYLAVGYCLLVLPAFVFQRRLLYLPTRIERGAARQLAEEAGLRMWTATEAAYKGWIARASGSDDSRGSVVVFQGNAGYALDRLYYVSALRPLGFNVILAEYPGYGARAGRPSEKTLVGDARQTIRNAFEKLGAPLYVWGESLGAGVAAAALAGLEVPVRGVVLLTPWDSLPNEAQALYPFLPAKWLMKDRFDSVRSMQEYQGRTAVIMAGKDEVIPNRLTRSLYESIRTEKRLWRFENAGHNNWPSAACERWWEEVACFLEGKRPDGSG